MLSNTHHGKGPLPEFCVYKPETSQNLTSTNICIFAVFCVGRRSRLMTNFKRDLIRRQKYSQPMGQGVGASLDPLLSPGSSPSLSEHPRPLAGRRSPRAMPQTGPRQRWGAVGSPVPARGAAGSPNTTGMAL